MTRVLPVTTVGRAVVLAAAAFAAGAAAAVTGAVPRAAAWVLVLAGAAASLAGSALGRRVVALSAGACLVVGGLGVLRGASAAVERPLPPTAATLRGVVRDLPSARRGETLVVLDLDTTSGGGTVIAAIPGRLDALPGDRVELQPTSIRDPGSHPGPLSTAALDRDGVDWVASAPRLTVVERGGIGPGRLVAMARTGIADTVDHAVPEPEGTLLSGIAFGIHGTLPTGLDTSMRDAGLIHLVATSGLKVAIVAGVIGRLLGAVAAAPRTRRWLTIVAVGAYVAVAGGGAAALRSALMGGVALMAGSGGRRTDPLPLLATVAAGLLLWRPLLAVDAGFQLSFLGTLGILVLARPVARLPGPRLLVEPFAVTLAAQVATLPVMGATFGIVSLVGPLANAVAVPLVPPLVLLAWLGVALGAIAPVLGALPLAAAEALTRLVEAVGGLAASLPLAAIHLPDWPRAWTWAEMAALLAAAAGGWWLRHHLRGGDGGGHAVPFSHRSHHRPSPRAVAALAVAVAAAVAGGAVLVLAGRPDGRLHVSVLDAGTGAAVLVRTGEGGLALVDGGSDPQRLVDALGAALPAGTHTLDLVVLTGGERGAVAGLADLTAHLAVGGVVVPDADIGTAARATVLAMRAGGAAVSVAPMGVEWHWAGAAWRFLSPGVVDTTGTNPPLCALQVAEGGGSALLLGDLPPAAQDELAAIGDGLRSDLLVAPPTGSLAASLVDAVRPAEVAVPTGRRTLAALAAVLGATTHLRTTGADGRLEYVGGAGGMLGPA